MKPLRGAVWAFSLLLVGAGAAPVHAAWCNVFQACCFFHKRASTSYYVAPAPVAAAPCCDPCPQPTCTTRYYQRCYYQPVTTYQTKTYYEPVTTYRTSYYYEPVTSYRYSAYYDPCTCSYQQVACPTTSYKLRAQCCPVQSWVQRCCSVPVTSYQQAFYWEPVTSCCSAPATPACPPETPAAAVPGYGTAPAAVPGYGTAPAPGTLPPPPPGVSDSSQGQPSAGVSDYPSRNSDGMPYTRSYWQSQAPPLGSGSSYRQVAPQGIVPQRQQAPAPIQPSVRLDRIASLPSAAVQGEVLQSNRVPWSGAKVLFVSADWQAPRKTVDVDVDVRGQFRASLASGGWLVYVQGPDGKPTFYRKIEVKDNQTTPPVHLVSR